MHALLPLFNQCKHGTDIGTRKCSVLLVTFSVPPEKLKVTTLLNQLSQSLHKDEQFQIAICLKLNIELLFRSSKTLQTYLCVFTLLWDDQGAYKVFFWWRTEGKTMRHEVRDFCSNPCSEKHIVTEKNIDLGISER